MFGQALFLIALLLSLTSLGTVAQTPDTSLASTPDVESVLEGLSDETAGAEHLAEVLTGLHENTAGGFRVEILQRVTRRLDVGRGYDADTTRTVYVGGPSRVYTRVKVAHGRRFALTLVAEKDPGERFSWSPKNGWFGVDHLSGSFAVRELGLIRSFIVGDFVAAFGQGLAMSHGLSAGPGRNVVAGAIRSSGGARAYGSAEENRFFRGAALTIGSGAGLELSLLASRRLLDATNADGGEGVTALGSTGLHRTPSELEHRDQVRKRLLGVGLAWHRSSWSVGAVGYSGAYDKPVVPRESAQGRFDFAGVVASAISIYTDVSVGGYTVVGEAARDQGGSSAWFAALSARIGRSTRVILSMRRYPRDFAAVYGSAFGQTGTPQNEEGAYIGIRVQPTRKWTISAFADQYHFPWARFGIPTPSAGYEALVAIEHAPRSWIDWYLQARTETRGAGYRIVRPDGVELDALRDETKQSLRWHLSYTFSPGLTISSRVETTRFHASKANTSYGFLLYQDIRLSSSPVRLDMRLTLFDTDDFDARVFAYETDLSYAFSSPAFSGKGRRFYTMLTYGAGTSIVVQVKYGATRMEHVTTVGSGLDAVDGNRIREFRAQVFLRL